MTQFKPQMVADVKDVVLLFDTQIADVRRKLHNMGIRETEVPTTDGPPPFPSNAYDLPSEELGKLQSIYQRWLEFYVPRLTIERVEEQVAKEVLRAVESIVFTSLTGTIEDRRNRTKMDMRVLPIRKRLLEASSIRQGIESSVRILEKHLQLLSRTIELRKLELDGFTREQATNNFRNPIQVR